MRKELWECEICRSVIFREQINGVCQICGRRTCPNCRRVCERCQRVFCMYDIEKVEVWRQGQMQRLMLCKSCRIGWV